MIILTVFVQKLQKTKRKAGSQHNEEKEYMSKSDENFPKLPLSKNPTQLQPCNLDGTGMEIIFVIS